MEVGKLYVGDTRGCEIFAERPVVMTSSMEGGNAGSCYLIWNWATYGERLNAGELFVLLDIFDVSLHVSSRLVCKILTGSGIVGWIEIPLGHSLVECTAAV